MTRTAIALTALLLAGLALAQGPRFGEAPRTTMTARMQADNVQQAGRHGPSQLGASMRGAMHGVIGLSEEELHARKEAGASIATIAAEEGIERATLEAAYLQARAEAIDALLATEAISELQAERMRERGPDVFATIVDREGLGGGQHMTGEPLMAQRADAPGGPRSRVSEATPQHKMEPMRRGPRGSVSD